MGTHFILMWPLEFLIPLLNCLSMRIAFALSLRHSIMSFLMLIGDWSCSVGTVLWVPVYTDLDGAVTSFQQHIREGKCLNSLLLYDMPDCWISII